MLLYIIKLTVLKDGRSHVGILDSIIEVSILAASPYSEYATGASVEE